MPTVEVQIPDLTAIGKSLVDVSANLSQTGNSIPVVAATFTNALKHIAGLGAAASVVYSITSLFRAPNIVVINSSGSGTGGDVSAVLASSAAHYRSNGYAGLFFTLWVTTSIGLVTFGLYRERGIREEIRIRQLELDQAEEEMRLVNAQELEELRKGRSNLENKLGKTELLKSDLNLEQLLPEETSRRLFTLSPQSLAQTPLPLTFNGSADRGAGTSTITLTNAAANQTGSVYLVKPVDLLKGFVCEFSFRMLRDRGDGIAFVLQGAGANAVGMHGYGLGYDGITRALAVEFDSYRNKDTADPDVDYHIALMMTRGGAAGGKLSSHHSNCVAWIGPDKGIPKFNDGRTYTCRVIWEPEKKKRDSPSEPPSGNGILRILWKTHDTFNTIIAKHIVNLPSIVGSFQDKNTAWLGFTAGTGGSYQKQEIVHWTLFEEDVPYEDQVVEVTETAATTKVISVEADGKGSAASAIVGEIVKQAFGATDGLVGSSTVRSVSPSGAPSK